MAKYNFDGNKYKKASKHQKEGGFSSIAQLGLRGDETILDIGCGDGVLTRKLASLVPGGSVVGIDASPGMIRTAKTLSRKNLKFFRKDIVEDKLAGQFDLLYSNATLHWVLDHKKLLRTCIRLLNKNGIMHFRFAARGNCSNLNSVLKPEMKKKRFADYFNKFVWPWYMPGKKEYLGLLESFSSLQAEYVRYNNADRYFKTKHEMIKWIDQPCLVPFLAKIHNHADKEAFRDSVVRKMVKRTTQPDGTCFETFRGIHMRARKA